MYFGTIVLKYILSLKKKGGKQILKKYPSIGKVPTNV